MQTDWKRLERYIRQYLYSVTANTVACSIVTSRLDYCNSILLNTSQENLHKLQHVQNNLVRLVVRAKRHNHITAILKNLHRLPIRQRIEYKVALITHRVYYENVPGYLSSLIQKHRPTRDLRSANQFRLVKPTGLSSKLGSQSFSTGAEKVWNSLSIHLRSLSGDRTFKTNLKTHYVSQSSGTNQPAVSV